MDTDNKKTNVDAVFSSEGSARSETGSGFESFVAEHGWSGSTIKLIAVITMLIDHIGAGIVENFAVQYPEGRLFGLDYDGLYKLDMILRGIGRIAFPIFCFLLVEGFFKTRSVWKYLGRLMIFGVISEVPFDLCFFRSALYTPYQNVYFTLALGVLMMICLERIKLIDSYRLGPGGSRALRIILASLTLIAFAIVAQIFMTDYYMLGIITIFLLYTFKKTRLGTCAAHALSCILVLSELPALAGVIPIALYNGKRGFKMKYFFYLFYPAHLMVLWGISRMLGIS